MTEVQKADMRVRRKALLVVAAGGLIGIVAIAFFERNIPELERWLRWQSLSKVQWVLWVLCAFIEVPVIAAVLAFWKQGKRILTAQRFPPPGVPVIRDTPVLYGDQARRRGRAIQELALLLLLSACMLPILFWRLAERLQPLP